MRDSGSGFHPMTRRRFLTLGAFGTSAAAQAAVRRERRGEMAYRRLGRTDLMVSEVSLGGSPPPDEPLFSQAMDLGINYVDTSPAYGEGSCERLVGKMIRDRRDRFYVTGKVFAQPGASAAADYVASVEATLERMRTDYLDILQIHGAERATEHQDAEILEAFRTLKEQGKIRFAGLTCHTDPVAVLEPAIRSGHYDVVTIAYNAYLDAQPSGKGTDYLGQCGIAQLIALANQHDVGVIAMKTLKCEKVQDLSAFTGEGSSMAQAMLKWALSNPGVSAVITEMLTEEQLLEDAAVSAQELTEPEARALRRYVAHTSPAICRSCGACARHCPASIRIPDVLRFASYALGQGKPARGRALYAGLPREQSAVACQRCGTCRGLPPFGLDTPALLAQAHRVLVG